MIWAAAIFDFTDGFAARLLKVKSSLGKELDSLADMISFGVLPALIIFNLIDLNNGNYLKYLALLIVVASALRLAKFNIDDRQNLGFIGLPTPASAIIVSSFPALTTNENLSFLLTPLSLVLISSFLSILMISNIRFISFKFNGYSFANNWEKYILLLTSLILIVFFQTSSIPFIFVLYFLVSLAKIGSPKQ